VADLTPEIVDEVVAACKAGAEETAAAFGRTFDAEIAVSVGKPDSFDAQQLPEELSGPGLAVVLTIGGAGAVLVLAESSDFVPEWCANPDPTGESKLTTLAQELGMLVLPEQFMPDDFKTARLKNLSGAIRRGDLGDQAAVVPLELSCGDKQGTARLIWPLSKPSAVIGQAAAKAQPQSELEPPGEAAKPESSQQPPKAKLKPRAGPSDLPPYTRSLLRVKVPVIVTLAEKRQPLGRIVELGPGSIIQFDKSCEEMLELDVSDCPVATGEAVKVDDKFGLRITSMIMPEERFSAVEPRRK